MPQWYPDEDPKRTLRKWVVDRRTEGWSIWRIFLRKGVYSRSTISCVAQAGSRTGCRYRAARIKIYAGTIRCALRLLVASAPDLASMTQREALLRIADWEEAGTFGGRPAMRCGDLVLVTIADLHLYHDSVDRETEAELGTRPELVVFLSKHRSESRTPSLTVHPLGNFGPADYGGRPATLVPTAPDFMTQVLRGVQREAAGLGYAVTFEATHHGPLVGVPAFFLEAGSTETEWRDARAAEALARAILGARPRGGALAIGVGGGHYVPRLTDVALARDVAFGHLVAGYAVPLLSEAMVDQVVACTPGARIVYFHRKAIEKSTLHRLEAAFAARGIESAREADLAPLTPQQSY